MKEVVFTPDNESDTTPVPGPSCDESILEAPSHALPHLEAERAAYAVTTGRVLYEHDGTVRGRPARTEGQMMGDLALIKALGSVSAARAFVTRRRQTAQNTSPSQEV